jgi:hypothetical protein
MTARVQVVSVRWNRSIEHVLASLCSERCSIWDLRRGGTPLMSIGDLGSYRASWRHLDWSADTSTLIAIASDDDAYPIVHVWDLRYTNSPVRQTQLHQRLACEEWGQCRPGASSRWTGALTTRVFCSRPGRTVAFYWRIPTLAC